ncbi:hypothetical protein QFZ47_005014 [Variovorax paradoxus]|nr:hypothetical protein [Variovorax paradoxus]
MRAPAAHAFDDVAERHVDFEHVVELDAGRLHGVGLRNGSREAVEQEAIGAIGLRDAFLHEVDDQVVAHETARFHDGLGLLPERRAGLDGGAQHVAGRNLRNAVLLANEGCLRAFARPGRAQQN